MVKNKALKALGKGVSYWNDWKKENSNVYNPANITGAILENQNFMEADFAEVIIDKASFHNVKLYGSNFMYSDIKGSKIKHCDFRNCNLHGTNFSNSNIFDTSFEEANLTSADFGSATLSNVIFIFPQCLLALPLCGCKDIADLCT
ncbi:MAG TPA: pentapeptide repeat-containing protein [Parafilimonas sp.]|nr:pentapeptide repeat-containing protein [Parafilimonas sp.]